MKFSPTITLALALAAGLAGAAAAQSTTTPSTMPPAPGSTGEAQPATSYKGTQSMTQPRPATTAEVMDAQQRLQAAGLYRGPADGMMDPDTRAAIARFQEQRGLQRTETLDQQTLSQLRSQPPASGSSQPPASSSTQPGAAAPPAGAGGSTGQQSPTR